MPRTTGEPDAREIDEIVGFARAVEATGLHACSVTDHPFPVDHVGRAGHQAHDPFVLLGYLAAATERVRLMFSLIVLPYRNPFVVARMLATLDLVSRGRVIAGIGGGYLREEFDAVGADYLRRSEVVEEGVRAMKAAWTGEPVRMATDRFRAGENVMRPVPVSRPHPPLWRGGNTRLALESAARELDGWMPLEVDRAWATGTATATLSLDSLAERIAVFHGVAERAGRARTPVVALVRPSPAWLSLRSEAIEQLQALQAMGVAWVVVRVAGDSPAARLDRLAELAEHVSAAGVSEPLSRRA